jgi:hypothetical protein
MAKHRLLIPAMTGATWAHASPRRSISGKRGDPVNPVSPGCVIQVNRRRATSHCDDSHGAGGGVSTEALPGAAHRRQWAPGEGVGLTLTNRSASCCMDWFRRIRWAQCAGMAVPSVPMIVRPGAHRSVYPSKLTSPRGVQLGSLMSPRVPGDRGTLSVCPHQARRCVRRSLATAARCLSLHPCSPHSTLSVCPHQDALSSSRVAVAWRASVAELASEAAQVRQSVCQSVKMSVTELATEAAQERQYVCPSLHLLSCMHHCFAFPFLYCLGSTRERRC